MWVVAALGVLAALTALLLSVPVDLDVRVAVHGRPSVHIRLVWLFGRVQKAFHTRVGARRPLEAPAARKKEEKRPSAGPKKEGKGEAAVEAGRLVWDLLHIPGLLCNVVRMVVRLTRCIKVRLLRVDFRVDLDDPADTALFVGAASQAAMIADLCSSYSFRLMPAFDGEALLDGEAVLAVRLRPICTVSPLVRFVFAQSALRAIVLVIRTRWKKRE